MTTKKANQKPAKTQPARPAKQTVIPAVDTTPEPEITAVTITRESIVALAKEMNQLLDLKPAIPLTKSTPSEFITAQIENNIGLLTVDDFAVVDDPEIMVFSESAKETYIALGFTVPVPIVKRRNTSSSATPKVKKERAPQYTRQHAFVDALKAGPGTKEELVKRAHEMYIAKHPDSAEKSTSKHHIYFVAEVQFRYTMQCFIQYGVVEFDTESKIYRETVPTEV